MGKAAFRNETTVPGLASPFEPEIHRAARLGDVLSLERLVTSGTDVDARGDLEFDHGPSLRGLTPLMIAAGSPEGADVATLRWLLTHGANLRATSEAGVTSAWYAAGRGGRFRGTEQRAQTPHAERLRFLLDAGLDPREDHGNGRSLLVEACAAGDPARVALLLDRGALHTPSWGPDEAARERGMEEAIRAHFEPATGEGFVDDRIPTADALLALAHLVRKGPGPPARAVPMFAAAASGSAECVRLLLRAGAAPDARDEDGRTPLMRASSAEVVRCLVEAGADPCAETPDGDDVIDYAIDPPGDDGAMPAGGRDVAAELVTSGATLSRIGRHGISRLARAAYHRSADVVDWLLGQGVRTASDSSNRQRPLHAICWTGEMGDPDANTRCERIVRALVAAGDDVEARDDAGRSAMSEAVDGDWGNPTAVRTLLALGARPDEPNADGTTPLSVAASHGEFDCIGLLLAAGADPTRRDVEEVRRQARFLQLN